MCRQNQIDQYESLILVNVTNVENVANVVNVANVANVVNVANVTNVSDDGESMYCKHTEQSLHKPVGVGSSKPATE